MAGLTMLTLAILVFMFVVTLGLEKGEILDMSYDLDADTPYFPGLGSWKLTIVSRGPKDNIPWLELNSFAAVEHGGTHMDAPSHFSEGKLRIDAIPVSKLVAPAVRVDISEQAKADRDYAMTAKDLQDWEEVHGKIPDGSILFVYTGWGAFYPDRLAYLGSSRNDTYLDDQGQSLLHYPGVGPDAATWLVENRKILGLGIDAVSLDHGPSTEFMAHRILFRANIYGIENVANLDKLPNTGANVHALPIKIKDGSGAPARIVAMLDEEGTAGAATPSEACMLLGSLLGICFILLL